MVKEEWLRTARMRGGVILGEWVIMPNHLHAVVHLPYVPLPKQSLAALVRGFKGASTRRNRDLVGGDVKSLWQRGYYERVIRDEEELISIEGYIRANPDRWARPDR
jgi:REP element-mobilizing transposase RayT